MEFEGEFVVDEPRKEVWPYFNDPDVLEKCAPGCKEITMESASELQATLSVGVGSVKPTFDVDAVVTENEKPQKLGVRASGEASRNSFSVTAEQELIPNGGDSTKVQWYAEAEVSGMIASLGERALDSVTDRLVNEFFSDLEEEIKNNTEATDKLEAYESETDEEIEDQLQVETQGSSASTLSRLLNNILEKEISVKHLFSLVGSAVMVIISGLLWRRKKQHDSNKEENNPRRSGANIVMGVIAGVLIKTLADYLRGNVIGHANTESADTTEAAAEEVGASESNGTTDGEEGIESRASSEDSQPTKGLHKNPIDQLD